MLFHCYYYFFNEIFATQMTFLSWIPSQKRLGHFLFIFPKQQFIARPSRAHFKPVIFHSFFRPFTHSLLCLSTPSFWQFRHGALELEKTQMNKSSSLTVFLRCGITSSESTNDRYSIILNFLKSCLWLWSPLLHLPFFTQANTSVRHPSPCFC